MAEVVPQPPELSSLECSPLHLCHPVAGPARQLCSGVCPSGFQVFPSPLAPPPPKPAFHVVSSALLVCACVLLSSAVWGHLTHASTPNGSLRCCADLCHRVERKLENGASKISEIPEIPDPKQAPDPQEIPSPNKAPPPSNPRQHATGNRDSRSYHDPRLQNQAQPKVRGLKSSRGAGGARGRNRRWPLSLC